jgi:hypothetical protein
MAFAAFSAAPALAEDWTVIDSLGEQVEFRMAGPASWRAGGDVRDGTVIRSFIHVDSGSLLRRGLIVTTGFLSDEEGSSRFVNPGDRSELYREIFAVYTAEELMKNRQDAKMRLISDDVVVISGLNAIRMVVEADFEASDGRILEVFELSVLAYEREDGRRVQINVFCSYRGLAGDRKATANRFMAERGPICKRFADSVALLDKRVPATAPPEDDY